MKHNIDTKAIDSIELYKILVNSVVPRPIAWVSSQSLNGIDNLAPFSFFTIASIKPPILCFAPALKDVGGKATEKDTLRNIRETGEFVVNIVSRNNAEKMNQTSYSYPPNDSEFEAVKLDHEPSNCIKPKRVAESLINLECKLFKIIDLGYDVQSGSLILGEIVMIHLDERVFEQGKINTEKLDPIGRLGGLWYAGIHDRFEIKRPTQG